MHNTVTMFKKNSFESMHDNKLHISKDNWQ